MKRWKVISSVVVGIAALSVIAVVLYYSIPINPCTLMPFQNADAILAFQTTQELYDSSELVAIGRITDSSAKCEGSQIWTHMQIEVEDSAKNPQNIKALTGKSFGGKIGNYGYWVEDSPIFEKGNRVFLYLYKDKPDDTIYRISPYSVVFSNSDVLGGTFTAKEILRTFSLQSATTRNYTTIDIKRGTSEKIIFTLESFFGYDSPTNVTMTSFTYYNDMFGDNNGPLTTEYADVSVIKAFGLSVNPTYTTIQPVVNGTTHTQFTIDVSNNAILGVYDIVFSATPEDAYSYLAEGIGQTFVRINVTDNGVHSNYEIPSLLTAEGITLGTPYLVQVSWNVFETLHGNGTDLSVLIKDKETIEPLKQVTYDFGYKGAAELGGFQDRYIEDFSNPHTFRAGIKNPCDMHLTIFIDKVGDQSFASTDLDTSSVGIQFRTFPESESEECDSNNIKLSLFNGYDLNGDRVPS